MATTARSGRSTSLELGRYWPNSWLPKEMLEISGKKESSSRISSFLFFFVPAGSLLPEPRTRRHSSSPLFSLWLINDWDTQETGAAWWQVDVKVECNKNKGKKKKEKERERDAAQVICCSLIGPNLSGPVPRAEREKKKREERKESITQQAAEEMELCNSKLEPGTILCCSSVWNKTCFFFV